jgi:hypothetical protein
MHRKANFDDLYKVIHDTTFFLLDLYWSTRFYLKQTINKIFKKIVLLHRIEEWWKLKLLVFFAWHLNNLLRMPLRSIKIMVFINLRVSRRKFEIQLIITCIEEASEWNLLLFKIRDQMTRDYSTPRPRDQMNPRSNVPRPDQTTQRQ